MPTRIVANTAKFVVFDLQKLSATQHMIFGADYVLIRPKTTGCTLYLADTHYRLSVNQIVLLAPFNPFRLSLDPSAYERNITPDCDALHFRLNGLGQTLVDSQQFSSVMTMLDNARHALLYEGEQIQEIGKTFDLMENSFDFRQVLHILGVLDSLSREEPKQCLLENCIAISHVKRTEDKLNSSLKYIQEHLYEPLTVAMIASQVYMAESTFSRFFHANMGVTFWQYVIEQRVRQAARLLVKTEHSISYICAEVGFTSISSFNSKFKELLKQTPKQYRNSHTDMKHDIVSAKTVKSQLKKQIFSLA